jgi:glutathione synthase/RimK-type ligase-like ATP-grasp enzyme
MSLQHHFQPASAFAPQPVIGLAALTRRAMRGESLAPFAQMLKARLAADPDDASALMDLSTIEQLRGSRAARLRLQREALARRKLFAQRAPIEGAPRLLALLAPGDFMANAPLEFLLEDAPINVEFLYVDGESELDPPPHDVAIVAVAESRANQDILALIDRAANHWPRPLLNAPAAIARLTRDGAWRLLGDLQGVFYPRNLRLARDLLADGAAGPFPIIIRPVDSHAGEELEKMTGAAELSAYLRRHDDQEFYASPFIDYSGDDGKYRKMRLAFIGGQAYPLHMAVSSRWMVHYLNADMLHNAAHRAEEEIFMRDFVDFAQRHATALAGLVERLELDYFQIDCAETDDGRLLIFEVGTAMIAHDFDCPKTFPYKSPHMRDLFDAFRRLVVAQALPA